MLHADDLTLTVDDPVKSQKSRDAWSCALLGKD